MKTQGKRRICIFLAVILALQMTFIPGVTVFADIDTPGTSSSDVDIYGVSLVLNGKIGLTFHMKVKQLYRGGTVELKFENKEDAAPVTMNIKDCPSEGITLYSATYYLSAVELSEPVTLSVYAAEDTEHDNPLARRSCSAEEYVGLLRDDEKATEFEKKVGEALIDYGHYAQIACSEADGWEIGKDYAETSPITDELRFDTSVFKDYIIEWARYDAAFPRFAMSLQLDSLTGIRLYLPLDEKPTVIVTSVSTAETEALEATESERLENCYEVFIEGINALNLGDKFEVTVNTVTFILSAFSYCDLAVSGGANESTVNAMRALYGFYDAISEYLSIIGE